MKSHFYFIWGLVGLAAVVTAPMLPAAVVTTYPYPVGAANSYVPPGYSSSTSIAASASNAVTVALNAQALILKEMLQEHQSRATELTQKNENEKAKWETELVNELQEKSDRVQKSIEQMSQAGTTVGDVKAVGAKVDDELVFVSTIEERLAQIRQELSAAMADSLALGLQLATNKAPDAIAATSSALGENQRLVNELQKQQADLELRELEFRAIRKAVQK